MDPLSIPLGKNNQFIENVSFEIGAIDALTTFLRLDDSESPRYSPPADVVNKPEINPDFTIRRLDACGLSV